MITLDRDSAALLAQVLPTLMIALALEGRFERVSKGFRPFLKWLRCAAVVASSFAIVYCIFIATSASDWSGAAIILPNIAVTGAAYLLTAYLGFWSVLATVPFGDHEEMKA